MSDPGSGDRPRLRKVILEGGPADLPRTYLCPGHDTEKITISRLNGYEHFEATSTHEVHDEGRLQVYRWSYRTAIAE